MQEQTDSPARAMDRTPFAALSRYFDTPLGLLVLVSASVFIAEAAVMFLFTLLLPPLSPLLTNFLDAFLLIILVFPALYIFLLRPLTRQIEERRRVEAELQQARAELETRVQDRTEELMIANQELHDEILERQRVEARLRESEERFRLTLKNAPVSVAAQDRDLRFRWAYNQRTVDPAAVIGKLDTDVFPPEDAARLVALKRRALETETEIREQFWLTSGGKRVFIDLYLEPMLDATGQVTGIGIATVDLTRMKLAEEALRESEERLRALYVTMSEGLANHEVVYREGEAVDYIITDVNPAFERITGLARSDVVGRKASDLFGTESPPYLDVYARVAASGAPEDFETYFPPMKKHFTISVFSPGRGKFATVFTDITERKRVEERMAWLASFPELNPNPISEVDLDGCLQYLNPVAKRLFPDLAESGLQHPWLAELESVGSQSRMNGTTVAIREVTIGEATYQQTLHFVSNYERIRIYGFDISERKRAVDQLRLQATALQAAANAIVITRPDGTVQWVNAAFTRMTGYSASEVIGQSPRVFKSGWHDAAFYHAMWQTIQDGRVWRDEIVNRRKDGSLYTEDMTITPVVDTGGGISYFIAIKQDITARKQAEEELAHQHAMLQAVIESSEGPIFSVDDDLRYTSFNARHADVMKSLFGADIEIGRNILDYHTNPIDRMAAQQNLDRGRRGESFTVESLVGEEARTRRYFEIAHNPVRDAYNAVIGVAVYARDITDRKKKEDELGRLNRTLRALRDSSQAMARVQDEAQYLAEVCKVVVEDCGHAMVWIGFANEDEGKTVQPVASAGFEEGYLATLGITWADTERGRGPTGTAIRTGQISRCRNMLSDPSFAPWREEALKRGYASSLAIPLGADGHAFGSITIYSPDLDAFTDREIELLKNLADDLAYGITTLRTRAAHARAEAALHRAHDELEARVADRTQELAQANLVLAAEIVVRRRAEAQVRLHTTAMEAAANGILIANRAGEIEWCNPAVTRMTGYTAEELIGRNPRLFGSGQHSREFYRELWSTIESGQTWQGEIINRRKDGSLYTEEQTITPVLGEHAAITHFIAIKQDITDRKRAESVIRLNAARAEALSDVSHALVEASLDYQTVLDAVAHGASRMVGGACVIHLLSEDGQWLILATVNHADPDIAGALRQLLAAKPFNVHEALAAQLIGAGQPLLMPSAATTQLRDLFRLDVDVLPVWMTAISLVSVPLQLHGKVIGAVTVWHDRPGPPLTADDQLALQGLADRAALAIDNAQLYTDLQQSLQKEQNTRQQLVQAETFAALGRIVAAVSHELNNPLQTIRNCLFLIQQEIQPDGLMHEYFQMAAAEFGRLTNLVAQLRALQRSRVAQAMQPLDLCALVADVHGLLEAELSAHRIRWQSSIETSHCTIVGTFDQLKQVCLNIGLNALEAMQAHGGTLSVDVIASEAGEQVGVRFRDTGPGIEPENLTKVFEPLFTTKPNGLGLGLPICYEIVQRHNGLITVESESGHGATFTVWLPLADDA